MINFYTDGACNMNKSGGWAYYSPELELRVCGQTKETTNNRMELTAILELLKFIQLSELDIKDITIHSDSAWSIGAITQEWKITENLDLVSEIKDYLSKLNTHVAFNKVKGHSGLEGNVIVDNLAVIMSNL